MFTARYELGLYSSLRFVFKGLIYAVWNTQESGKVEWASERVEWDTNYCALEGGVGLERGPRRTQKF